MYGCTPIPNSLNNVAKASVSGSTTSPRNSGSKVLGGTSGTGLDSDRTSASNVLTPRSTYVPVKYPVDVSLNQLLIASGFSAKGSRLNLLTSFRLLLLRETTSSRCV